MLRKVGAVAYELALLPDFPPVHLVFHISMLRKYVKDPAHVLQHQHVAISFNLTYEAWPAQIVDRQVRKLRNKELASVKVVWENHPEEEATWEAEANMRTRYPHLFP